MAKYKFLKDAKWHDYMIEEKTRNVVGYVTECRHVFYPLGEVVYNEYNVLVYILVFLLFYGNINNTYYII